MNDLELKKEYLPSTIEDLSKFVLFGREKLVSVKAEIRAMDKLSLAQEVRTQKKEEAQMLAEALLDAEIKIGEISKMISTAQGMRTDLEHIRTATNRLESGEFAGKTKAEVIKELGFSKDQVYAFETLADNPDLVEQVKAEARENEDLPTRTQVLSLAKARQDRYERECKELDQGFIYYKHMKKAFIELNFVKTDVRELKRLVDVMEDETVENDLQFLDEAISTLGTIKSAILQKRR